MDVQYVHNSEAIAASYRYTHIELVRESASCPEVCASSSYALVIVIDGEGRIALGNGGARLQRGVCLLLAPDSANRIEAGKGGLAFYRARFDLIPGADGSMESIERTTFGKFLRRTIMTCQSVSSCMLLAEQLYANRMKLEELEQLENQIRFQTLLLNVLGQFRLTDQDNDLHLAIERSIAYMRERYDEPLSIERLAAMSAASRRHYTQVFKEMTGRTPIDYLNQVRIDKAQQLLLLTDDKLDHIAQAVGYSNEYYFNRKFKQKVGVTPGQYRSSYPTCSRIFAPFLEDYLLALGIVPVMQYSHKLWGRQEYLGLSEVPDFDVSIGDWTSLARHQPELIILDDGCDRWSLDHGSHISPVFKLPYPADDWQVSLHALGTILGRREQASRAIEMHKSKLASARSRLARTMRSQTVAVLRITAKAIYLYGGEERGYTGPLLYNGLGLSQPYFVQRFTKNMRRIRLDLSELDQLDADHLFITFDRGDGEDAGRQLLESPTWRTLSAVRQNQVYEVDFMAWMNYGVLSHQRKMDDVLSYLG